MDLISVLVNRTWLTFGVCFYSTLIRKLGGFFIRRKMEETEDGKKDILYRSLLYAVSPTALHVIELRWTT